MRLIALGVGVASLLCLAVVAQSTGIHEFDYVETRRPAGEYAIDYMSPAITQEVIDSMRTYAATHSDRKASGGNLVVVVDESGQAKFRIKISYSKK